MEINIVFKNIKADDDVREYAERKLVKLYKYLSSISNIKMELSKEKSKSRQRVYTAQITINVNGFLIRGEHKGQSIRALIDETVDTAERQIKKYKKRYEVNKGRSTETIRVPADVKKRIVEDRADVLRTKRFIVKPTTVEQAIEQMEFIGHDFFIFANIDDKSVNVVYRRKDGKYGVIIPELA